MPRISRTLVPETIKGMVFRPSGLDGPTRCARCHRCYLMPAKVATSELGSHASSYNTGPLIQCICATFACILKCQSYAQLTASLPWLCHGAELLVKHAPTQNVSASLETTPRITVYRQTPRNHTPTLANSGLEARVSGKTFSAPCHLE